ncbi:hypothetical protein FKM82_023078 [Ascaphus truei]
MSVLTHTMRYTILLLLLTWIQCSPDQPLREVRAILRGSVSVTCRYDMDQHRSLVSSWCRQVSRAECDDVVDSIGTISKSHQGRVTISQIPGKTGSVTVTMTQLQDWDSGLYIWRTWTGKDYKVKQSVLLQVVEGLPSSSQVVRATSRGDVQLHCSYNKQQNWSKVWCKQKDARVCDWVAHSDGDTNSDYQSRPHVSNDPQARRMSLTLTRLELWDSGVYRCQESGGSTVLENVLLLVTPEETQTHEVTVTGEGKSRSLTTRRTTKLPTHPLPVRPDGRHFHSVGVTPNKAPMQTPSPTFVPARVVQMRHGAWDVLRWLLLLGMVGCLLFVSCYDRLSGLCHNFPFGRLSQKPAGFSL